MAPVNLLVEGVLDEMVGRRLIAAVGGVPGTVFGKRGCDYIQSKISGFNKMAVDLPLLVLVDFVDTKAECPPSAARTWLPLPGPKMIFRLVVPEIEGWLLADRQGMASFLGIGADKLPQSTEDLEDPKRTLVSLARRSRHKRLREALVPAVDRSVVVGPLYNSELSRFVMRHWDPDSARTVSPSLDSCLRRMEAAGLGRS